MSRFVTVDRDTAYLLPPSVDEWLPANHLARFVVEVIGQLDLSALTRQYGGRGSARRRIIWQWSLTRPGRFFAKCLALPT
jgi:hypothetical protein